MAKSDLVDLTDGTDVSYRKDGPDYWAVWDGKSMKLHKGRQVEKYAFLSHEYVEMSYNPQGRRVFTGPQWYFEKLGLV